MNAFINLSELVFTKLIDISWTIKDGTTTLSRSVGHQSLHDTAP